MLEIPPTDAPATAKSDAKQGIAQSLSATRKPQSQLGSEAHAASNFKATQRRQFWGAQCEFVSLCEWTVAGPKKTLAAF